jgi:hypothetical protein
MMRERPGGIAQDFVTDRGIEIAPEDLTGL